MQMRVWRFLGYGTTDIILPEIVCVKPEIFNHEFHRHGVLH